MTTNKLWVAEPKKLITPGSKEATTTDRAALRAKVAEGLTISGMTPGTSYLSYAGILPLDLPDGTTGVIFPDMHVPAHKRTLVWPLLQFLTDFHPHLLISIGDWWDLFAVSRHPKNLRVSTDPQGEFDEGRRLWDAFMEAADALWAYIINGNHEDRFYRAMMELMPALGSMIDPHTREPLSMHSMVGYTKEDNITFLYGTEERGGFEGGLLLNDLELHHGIVIAPKPGQSPLRDADRWSWRIAHGHTHRAGTVAVEVAPSEQYFSGVKTGTELGNLVDADHSYMAYAKQMFPNWHHGFGVFTVHNGSVHLQFVPIKPGKDGRLVFTWQGNTYTEDDQ